MLLGREYFNSTETADGAGADSSGFGKPGPANGGALRDGVHARVTSNIEVASHRIWRNGIVCLIMILFIMLAAGRSNAQDLPPGSVFRDCPECPEMVVIPAGHFKMGSTEADTERDIAAVPHAPAGFSMGKLLSFGESDESMATKFMSREHPQHAVTIPKDFGLGRYLVTAAEFSTFVEETGYRTATCYIHFRRNPDWTGEAWKHPGFVPTRRDPVVCVSWNDAKAYILWLNGKIGLGGSKDRGRPYRLPSEAEWEYAARAGTQTARWWGDLIGSANAKCDGCEDLSVTPRSCLVTPSVTPACRGEYERRTAMVGSFDANPFGLFDMLGNAWEWTEDCWNKNYEGAPADGRPWISGDCGSRVNRGGGWNNNPWSLRSTTRTGARINLGDSSSGFRLAKTLQ